MKKSSCLRNQIPQPTPKGEYKVQSKGNHIDFPAFLASVTHDMKNSLGMLLNTLDEIISQCNHQPCASSKLLSQIQYEGKRVNNNLIQLLTIYKMDNSLFSLNISLNQVSEFTDEIILLNKPLSAMKGIEILSERSADLLWFFDYDLIAGVINNILDNAFKYTRDKIWIAAREINGYLNISIEDNGNGYPECLLGCESTGTESVNFETGSTGLGLYFASQVARMHKNKGKEGFISISNNGHYSGGCFTIALP